MTLCKTTLPRTVEEVLAHAGGVHINLTEAELDRLWDEGFGYQQHMLVFRPESRQVGFCSSCRNLITLLPKSQESRHKGTMKCPSCSANTDVVHMWRYRSRIKADRAIRYVYRRSVLEPACVVAWCLYVERPWEKETAPEVTSLEWIVDSVSVFVPGKGGMMIRPQGGGKITSVVQWNNGLAVYAMNSTGPRPRHRVYENHGYYYNPSCIEVTWDREGLLEAVKGSPLSYGLEEYIDHAGGPCIRYLDKSQRLPALEMLVKIGLGRMVAEHLDESWEGTTEWSYGRGAVPPKINWRGKSLEKILYRRLSKEDKRWLQAKERNISPSVLGLWQSLPSQPPLQTVELCREAPHNYLNIEVEHGVPLVKTVKYLAGQKNCGPIEYLDYLRECRTLGYDRSKDILFPKDLMAAHQRTSALVRLQTSKELDTGYLKRRKLLVPVFSFEDESYRVVLPKKLQALVKEGKDQHNCVGGYMKRVAAGETNVVFVRAKDKPRQSLGTVEIDNHGVIIQARAAYNKALPEEVMLFVDRFAEEIRKRIGKRVIGA